MTDEVVYIERKKKRWEGNAHTHICRQGETAYAVGQSYAIRTRSFVGNDVVGAQIHIFHFRREQDMYGLRESCLLYTSKGGGT